MMHKNAKPWTKAEKARAQSMKDIIGCIRCFLNSSFFVQCQEIHHIISGNKRMGHWWTLPLCRACHVAAHDSTFKRHEQIDHWLKVQHILGLSDELPTSKILPRRVA